MTTSPPIILPKSRADLANPERMKDLRRAVSLVNALQRLRFELLSGGQSSGSTIRFGRSSAVLTATAHLDVQEAISFDLTAGFSLTTNPLGVWSYGYTDTSFNNFTLYTYLLGGTLPTWRRPAVNEPNVYVNPTATTQFGVPPKMVALHPGPGFEPSVIRWTAPANYSSIRIVGQFYAGDLYTMIVSVRRGSNVLFLAPDSGGFAIRESNIAIGDTIDFCVSGGYTYGSTPITAVITATI